MKTKVQITSNGSDPAFKRVCATAASQMKKMCVPGMALGIFHKGREYYSGLGVTSIETELPVDADTLFQIGSITKTFLAQAAVMLAEKGKLDLDAPIRRYLPEFKLKDSSTAVKVTMRHLLTHTGGWFGDYFNDFGSGDDALKRMVEEVGRLPQITPFGKIWSYNNSGFYVAGRVLEKVAGKAFEKLIHELIFAPLAMDNSFFSADDAISRRFAVGHKFVKGKVKVARPWAIGRAAHPAGGVVCSARDLMKYARFHMGDGRLTGGKRLISRKGMKALHTPLFHATGDKSVALSWFVAPLGKASVISHSGGTNGQQTQLNIVPQEKYASIIFTNGNRGSAAAMYVYRSALKEFLARSPEKKQYLTLPPKEVSCYLGQYVLPDTEIKIFRKKNSVIAQLVDKGGFPTPKDKPEQQPSPSRIAFYGQDKIEMQDLPYKGSTGEFIRDEKGKVSYLRLFSRVHVRK
ncbi:MAG TPA: penicillin-binding protein [Elusimicrobia bacterium]|nr:penicillin-binding protein [Elusimicrobiota bacterium]